jgi:hypothetical protein
MELTLIPGWQWIKAIGRQKSNWENNLINLAEVHFRRHLYF